MKLYELNQPNIPTRIAFHDSSPGGAVDIVKSGAIKPLATRPEALQAMIDDEVFDDMYDGGTPEENAQRYGKHVYASTYLDDSWDMVTSNLVLFVIDMSKLPSLKDVNYVPDAEGGLLEIPFAVPLSAVIHIHINHKRWSAWAADKWLQPLIKEIQNYPQIQTSDSSSRTRDSVIKQYKGK